MYWSLVDFFFLFSYFLIFCCCCWWWFFFISLTSTWMFDLLYRTRMCNKSPMTVRSIICFIAFMVCTVCPTASSISDCVFHYSDHAHMYLKNSYNLTQVAHVFSVQSYEYVANVPVCQCASVHIIKHSSSMTCISTMAHIFCFLFNIWTLHMYTYIYVYIWMAFGFDTIHSISKSTFCQQ